MYEIYEKLFANTFMDVRWPVSNSEPTGLLLIGIILNTAMRAAAIYGTIRLVMTALAQGSFV